MNESTMFFTSFFNTLELVKLFYSSHKAIEVDKEIAPFLQMILSMENNVLSMKSYISKLEEENKTKSDEIMKLQKWSEIEKKYQLRDIAPGMPLQSQNIIIDSKETIQWACPKCWHNHIEQSLHRKYHSEEIGSYLCPVCKNTIEWNNCDYGTKKSRPTIG